MMNFIRDSFLASKNVTFRIIMTLPSRQKRGENNMSNNLINERERGKKGSSQLWMWTEGNLNTWALISWQLILCFAPLMTEYLRET